MERAGTWWDSRGFRVALVLMGLAAAALGVVRVDPESTSDWNGFHDAARHLVETGGLSSDKAVERYPPTFVVLLAPLGALPLYVAAALWQALNLAALLATPRALERLCGRTPREQLPAWIAVAPFAIDNLLLAQSGPLLLFLATAGLAACRQGRGLRGGALIGAAAVLKVLPAALLVVPLLLGRRSTLRSLLGAALALVLAASLVVLVVGPRGAVESGGRWWSEVREHQTPAALIEEGRSLRHNNQGLAVSIARCFGDLPAAAIGDGAGYLALDVPVLLAVHGALVGLLALVLLAVGLRARARGLAASPGDWLALFALTELLVLAASPIVWTHYLLWQLPAFVVLLGARRWLLVLGALSWLALAVPMARVLGVHALVGLVLFVLVASRRQD